MNTEGYAIDIYGNIGKKISVQNSRKSGTPGKIEWKGGENNEKGKCSLHDNRDCNADGPFFRDVHKRKQRFQQNLQIKPIFSR